MILRRSLLAAAAALALVSCSKKAEVAPTAAAPVVADYVTAAVADPNRAADRAIDDRRHPTELAVLSGVKPGDKVADLIPGNGYFTRIFSSIVGAQGHVYAVWPNEYAKESATDVASIKALVALPAYANVSVLTQPGTAFAAPEPLDVVFTSMNYHDYPDEFMGKIDPMVLNRAVYAALRPGGCFIIIDHASEAGAGMRDTETLHRIDPAIVKAQVSQAGFSFEGESTVLANPADDHKLPVFDEKIRRRTDRFAYKFCKPLD